MKYATRINSFNGITNESLVDVIKNVSRIDGITHLDLNYPEHFSNSLSEIAKALKDNNLKLNGIAPRFRNDFIRGEFTNLDPVISRKAIDTCKKSIDVCRELGGEVVTIWLGYDGFDYPFQLNYEKAWNTVVQAFREICDYGKDIKVSIEYKPYQPRVFSLISSFGDSMLLVKEVGADNFGMTLDFCHMLMKGENPAYGLSIANDKNKLYGIHLNDGNRLNDDGLMTGTINLVQTIEFMYYLKKSKYDGAIYFDTFPIRENPSLECRANIAMVNKIGDLIDTIGLANIQKIIDQGNAIAVQDLVIGFLK